jgi:hypothetical protein
MSTWTVDDALRMQTALARWLSTDDGIKCSYAVDDFLHVAFPGIDPPTVRLGKAAASQPRQIEVKQT